MPLQRYVILSMQFFVSKVSFMKTFCFLCGLFQAYLSFFKIVNSDVFFQRPYSVLIDCQEFRGRFYSCFIDVQTEG